MTQEQILEGNRKIVKFMGIEPRLETIDGKFSWSDLPWFSTRDEAYDKAMDSIVGYVPYFSNWNWLMEVVKKIGQISAENNWYLWPDDEFSIVRALASANIESVFKCCLEFIDFYNDKNSH